MRLSDYSNAMASRSGCSYDERVLGAFFCRPEPEQGPPLEPELEHKLEPEPDTSLPGPRLHFRALASALLHARASLEYVLDALRRWDDAGWPAVQDTVARELAAGTMFLAGALDGMVLLEAALFPRGGGGGSGGGSGEWWPASSASFERTLFGHAALRPLQAAVKGLRSGALAGQARSADFWALAGFWRHGFPYRPHPCVFGARHGGVRDVGVPLGGGCASGPVLRDLLVPAFNLACGMMRVLAALVQEDGGGGGDRDEAALEQLPGALAS
jgi:hypothetical protein